MNCIRHWTLLLAISMQSVFVCSQSLSEIDARRVILPNGWGITSLGEHIELGDLPLNIAVSPDRKYLAVTNNGQSKQSIQLIAVKQHKVISERQVKVAWFGLAWAKDSRTLFASAGNGNYIIQFRVKEGMLTPVDSIFLGKPWPEKISIAGIALDQHRDLLYAVTKENNSLYVVNLPEKKVINRFPLGGEGYSCLLSKDGKLLYISCWGCKKVLIYDTGKQKISDSIQVGDHPNDMLLNSKGTFLFVANANDNSVSVINTKSLKVVEVLDAALIPDAPSGSTTNSLAMSSNGKTLYIANADNNCLALFDISTPGKSKSKGFIPTGWYPTCVKIVNNTIFVANGKGFGSLPNPLGPNPLKKKQPVEFQKGVKVKEEPIQYIAGLFTGTLSILPEPGDDQLSVFSQSVYRNAPYSREKEHLQSRTANNPVPGKPGGPSPIKYIFYIIKENRTYDQVLSDIPAGNGDTTLLHFGEKVTPNQHALAQEFVLLDNFYVDGEVSADGHNWSLGAYATDYLEKNWPTYYGGRGGSYDSEGSREIANNKNGFIWNNCNRNGVSYRTYGEFTYNFKPNLKVLNEHFCPYYPGWNMDIKDTSRFNLWQRDFDSLLAIRQVPHFNTVYFPNDHTEGLKLGRPTPFAHVADNDLAVGLFVEHLSHSSIWKESVVFILEDDAQNGPDHVDAHRSTAYIAGGFVKRKYVDHTMYSTSGMLHTIELILNLPPMSQYDASAAPMWQCFSDTCNDQAFNHLSPNIDLSLRNTAMNEWQQKSEQFDLGKEDRVPDMEFNKVLWYALKGDQLPCPAPRRAAFLRITPRELDGDD